MPKTVNHGFNLATVVQVGVIPIITGIIILSGFYYVTGATLARHDNDIATMKQDNKQSKEDEEKSREKVRNEYFSYQQKTNEILGKLDTRLAVSETKQETANQTLSKIADSLARINSLSVIPRSP